MPRRPGLRHPDSHYRRDVNGPTIRDHTKSPTERAKIKARRKQKSRR